MGETLQLVAESFMPMVIAGFKYSIPMMLISFFLGLLLALLVALGRMSRFKLLYTVRRFPYALTLQTEFHKHFQVRNKQQFLHQNPDLPLNTR